jgi:CubicO group peptidase (beta-lactamase class C family)
MGLINFKKKFFLWMFTLWSFAVAGQVSRDTNYHYRIPPQLNDGIAVNNLAAAGIDSEKIFTLTKLILQESFPDIHSLLIAKDGKLVYENYFAGADEIWGSKMPHAEHNINTLHDTRSISKSVVSACIGIAISQHKIKSIEDPIFEYLPTYSQYKTTANARVTIRHLITMSSGIAWEEDIPHSDPKNNEAQMERATDPVRYTLSLPMAAEPGSHWKYCSGGVQVLAAIIESVSGLDVDAFAQKYLFGPLGIKDHQWIRSSPGFPAAASGLRLRPRDLLKIGMLYMNEGIWNHARILPKNWAHESLSTQILRNAVSKTRGYGYLFWTFTDTVSQRPYDIAAAVGNGGQRIFMLQNPGLIVVITAGNYNNFTIPRNGEYALADYILPAFAERRKQR